MSRSPSGPVEPEQTEELVDFAPELRQLGVGSSRDRALLGDERPEPLRHLGNRQQPLNAGQVDARIVDQST